MRIIYVCGYDGNECKKYKVQLDDDGNVIKPNIDCTMTTCDRCGFMGKPWIRMEFKTRIEDNERGLMWI